MADKQPLLHKQFLSEDAQVGIKLWGQAAELHRTANVLAVTSLNTSQVKRRSRSRRKRDRRRRRMRRRRRRRR